MTCHICKEREHVVTINTAFDSISYCTECIPKGDLASLEIITFILGVKIPWRNESRQQKEPESEE